MEVAEESMAEVPRGSVQHQLCLLLQWETIKAQLLVEGSSKTKDRMYSQAAVKTRVNGVRRLEEVLASAIKLADSEVIEVKKKLTGVSIGYACDMMVMINY